MGELVNKPEKPTKIKCNKCSGTGQINNEKCPKCKGTGKVDFLTD